MARRGPLHRRAELSRNYLPFGIKRDAEDSFAPITQELQFFDGTVDAVTGEVVAYK